MNRSEFKTKGKKGKEEKLEGKVGQKVEKTAGGGGRREGRISVFFVWMFFILLLVDEF